MWGMIMVSVTEVSAFFSGKGNMRERGRVMHALLKCGAVNDAYRFLLSAAEDGVLEDGDAGSAKVGGPKMFSAIGSVRMASFSSLVGDGRSGVTDGILDLASRMMRRFHSKVGLPESVDKMQEAQLLERAKKGDYDGLLDYLYPVCVYLSEHLVDYKNKAYFSADEVQSAVFDKLVAKDGAFIQKFDPEKSSIKTWVSACLMHDLNRKKRKIDKERALKVSLDEPVAPGNSGTTFVDVLPDDYRPPYEKQEIDVELLIKRMDNALEQRIINERWLNMRTLQSVSDELGISVAKVCRVEKAALASLQRIARELGYL